MSISFSWTTFGEIRPYERNPRSHSPRQIDRIARSLQAFGAINPIVVDAHGIIIAGHARWLAARKLKLPEVPVIRVEGLSEDQIRAYRLADNRLAEDGEWDEALLRVEITHLFQVDFDVDLTGFETPEVDALFVLAEDPGDEGISPPPAPEETVTRRGDVWHAGPHRILCADCRDANVLSAVVGNREARMAISDPPYNVPIPGHVCGNGQHQHRDFICASGELSAEEFTALLRAFLEQQARFLMEGALVFVFMDWRHLGELLVASEPVFGPLFNLCVWAKTNAGLGSFYRSQHELVALFKHGNAAPVNNVQLGRYGRHRTNVWSYAGTNSFGAERDEALAIHPTVKPLAMIADAILDASHRSDIVLDSFLGSGTTLLAAQQTGRVCYGIELDPSYVDLSVRRWEAATGQDAIHQASGVTFRVRQAQRLSAKEVA